MSESVRELTVSLLLDSNQFERNIRTINKQIKEAESEFQLAAAGSETFEKSLRGMREKAASLTKQLESQNKIAGQYGEKIKSLNKRLDEQYRTYGRRGEEYKESAADLEVFRSAVKKTEAEIRAAQRAGADEGQTAALNERLKEQKKALEEAEKAHQKLGKELDNQQGRMRTTTDALADAGAGLNRTQAEIKELTLELNRNQNAWYTHGVAMQAFAERAQGAARSFERVGDGLTRTVTAPIIGLGAAAAKASIDYESAFAGVMKTVQVAEEEAPAFFEQLSDSVINMSKELATGAGDIAEVMAIAGQLGIENDRLVEFTDTIIRLGMSTNLAGEEAAAAMAKFANITDMEQKMFGKMGATLVQLGNRFATTEADIMNMATRIAAAGKQVGLTQPQILGFAAALSSVGLEAEAGGSAFSRALKEMEIAVATNSKKLKDFAKVAGLTEKEFKALWESEPAEAFEAFIVGLSRMDEEGIGAIATLNEMGFSQIRLSDTLLRATNATELFKIAQEQANAAWEEGDALMKESGTRLQTTASRLTNVKNSLVATGISFADTMAPEMERIVDALADGVEWFGKLDEGTRRTIVNWALAAAATGPVIKGVGKIGTTLTGAIGFIGKFSEAIGNAGAVMKATGSAAAGLGALLGSGGGLMLGIAGAAVALGGLIALMNRAERLKPDFSIDTSEIEQYRIDPVELQAKVDIDTATTISGDILDLESKFVSILNDGLPETEEIRAGMKADVDAAVGAAFGVIEETYNAKKLELDTLFKDGVIDEATYNKAMTTLDTQAQTMKDDLTGKAEAVTGYVTTLCDNNRKMTEEEIGTLNSLLESLAATAAEVGKVTDAQMQVYELAYRKAMMGMGTEEDMRKAAEYVELLNAQRQAEIEAKKAAAEAVTAEVVEGMSEEEQKEQIARLNEQTAALEAERTELEALRKQAQGGLAGAAIEEAGLPVERLERYLELVKKLDQYGIQREDGTSWWEEEKIVFLGLIDEVKELEAIEKELDKSGAMAGDSPINAILSTLAADGAISQEALSSTAGVVKTLAELVTGVDPAIDAVAQLKTGVEAEAETIIPTAKQTVEDGKPQFTEALRDTGSDAMAGISEGIRSGVQGATNSMRWAMGRIVAVAKDTLRINSPSKVFEEEVGRMAIRGFGKGVEEETKAQAQAMRNAARYLTGEAQTGAAAGSGGNSKTYNSESHVTVQVDKFIANDRQDIQALATEIAGLTRQQQRGRGLKHA